MPAFEIYLDVAASGRVMAHLLEPPGLGVRFPSRGQMEERLPAELDAHLAWLRSHGEAVPAPPAAFVVVEEIPIAGNFESGDDVGYYGPDAVPPTLAEVERYLRIGGHAHADLLSLVEPLDDTALDWVRDPRTRAIRKVVRHVVGSELWYMTRVIDDPDVLPMPEILQEADRRVDATEDMVERLQIIWPAFQQWARSLTATQCSRITTPTWFTRLTEERWTARKMLRRCIEHCREHARNVQQILDAYRGRGTRPAEHGR